MFTRLQVHNYRLLGSMDLDLGQRHVLVGPNGSGKSTLLDVLQFLSDFWQAGLEAATLGDERVSIPPRVSHAQQLLTDGKGGEFQIALQATNPAHPGAVCRYELEIGVSDAAVATVEVERLWLVPVAAGNTGHVVLGEDAQGPTGWRNVLTRFASAKPTYASETSADIAPFAVKPDASAMGSIMEDEDKFPMALWFKREVTNRMQRLALDGARLRLPAPAGVYRGMLPDGSNLAAAVASILSQPTLVQEWLDEVRTVVPDLRDVSVVERPEDRRRILHAHFDGGRTAPSYTLSDGTLRLMALTILPFLPHGPSLLMVEEPENGIHPQGVETVYRAFKNLYETQVLIATHSPIMVNQAELKEVLVFSRNKQGLTSITPATHHPAIQNWRGAVDKGTLFANGILS